MGDSAPKRKRRPAHRKNLFDVDIEASSKLSKSAPLSLFDDAGDSRADDLFDFAPKSTTGKISLFDSSVQPPQDDLLSPDATPPANDVIPAPKKRKSSRKKAPIDDVLSAAAAPPEPAAPPPTAAPEPPDAVVGPGVIDTGVFGYRDVRVRFGGVTDFRREVVRRFEHYESLVKSISFAQSGSRSLSSPIPDDVLRESVHRLVTDLHEKDAIIREKEILIDFLSERVTSTFERDELIKVQARRRAEIESERAETANAGIVVDQLRQQLEQLRGELKSIEAEAEQNEAAARTAHEQQQYRLAMEHFGDQEPLEKKMKDAKNEKVQVEIQLMPMLEDNARMKEGIDVEAFEGITKLKMEVPKKISAAIREMRDGVARMLENAFNPLREYSGDKVAMAVRNALQAQGRKVLSK